MRKRLSAVRDVGLHASRRNYLLLWHLRVGKKRKEFWAPNFLTNSERSFELKFLGLRFSSVNFTNWRVVKSWRIQMMELRLHSLKSFSAFPKNFKQHQLFEPTSAAGVEKKSDALFSKSNVNSEIGKNSIGNFSIILWLHFWKFQFCHALLSKASSKFWRN